jgi:hypothetical protein
MNSQIQGLMIPPAQNNQQPVKNLDVSSIQYHYERLIFRVLFYGSQQPFISQEKLCAGMHHLFYIYVKINKINCLENNLFV